MISAARVGHLARRWSRSIRGREPSDSDLDWVRECLTDSEIELFALMTTTDQAHGIEVARRTSESAHADMDSDSWPLAAALLHDIGKIESGLGTGGRVVATLIAPLVPDRTARRLAEGPVVVRSLARHLIYPELGSERLRAAGSDQRVCAWAAEHHLAPSVWTVPLGIGRILSTSDDESS